MDDSSDGQTFREKLYESADCGRETIDRLICLSSRGSHCIAGLTVRSRSSCLADSPKDLPREPIEDR